MLSTQVLAGRSCQVNEAAEHAHIPGHQSPAYFNVVNHVPCLPWSAHDSLTLLSAPAALWSSLSSLPVLS